MNKHNRSIILACLLLSSAFLGALETESSSFALDINEARGRFTLYARESRNRTALYVAEDPTTSYLSVLAANRIYRLGDSFDFRQTAKTTDVGGTITWTSSQLTVTAAIDISGSTYVIVDVSIENTSETTQDVGLRFLIDTYLGEDGIHFQTPSGPVSNETELLVPPEYVRSGTGSATSAYLLFAYRNASAPDRIVLANWKRLHDAGWNYAINTNRNFSVLPYSINDSAVSLYYEPVSLRPRDVRLVRIVLATALPQTATAAGASPSTSAGTSGRTTLLSGAAPEAGGVSTTLDMIELLIARINTLLDSGRDPSTTELQELEFEVERIKEHRDSE